MSTPIGTTTLGHGVNLQPSYYGNIDIGWSLMLQQPHIKSVRIEIEPGHEADAATWIADAQANGYRVIATYHKYTVLGSDDVNELLAAANWWAANCANLGNGFIINLMNEWGSHDITASAYADAYNRAIAIVRTVYSGYIIIDLPGWGQETQTACDAFTGGGTVISDPDIVLSVHVYKGSWNKATGQFLTTADLDVMAGAGLPCIIGEFGPIGDATTQCDWSACVDHARNLGWTVIGWCWNGDGNGFNMVAPAWSVDRNATLYTTAPYFNTIYSKLQ